jgi:hypothetical protein
MWGQSERTSNDVAKGLPVGLDAELGFGDEGDRGGSAFQYAEDLTILVAHLCYCGCRGVKVGSSRRQAFYALRPTKSGHPLWRDTKECCKSRTVSGVTCH